MSTREARAPLSSASRSGSESSNHSPAPNRRASRSRSRSHRRSRRSGSRSPTSPSSRRNGYEVTTSKEPRSSGGRSRRSRSPMSNRRRHVGTRDDPEPNKCLGVFGLSVYTTEKELTKIFNKFGPLERVQVVLDAKTQRSRGFSFIYFANIKDASAAKEECSGMEIDGRLIRVDYSITERPHTPTPGIYMGRPTMRTERSYGGGSSGWESSSRSGGGRDRDSRYRRSPSPTRYPRSSYPSSSSRRSLRSTDHYSGSARDYDGGQGSSYDRGGDRGYDHRSERGYDRYETRGSGYHGGGGGGGGASGYDRGYEGGGGSSRHYDRSRSRSPLPRRRY